MTKSVDNLKPSNSDNKQKILLDKDVAAMTSNSEITFWEDTLIYSDLWESTTQ